MKKTKNLLLVALFAVFTFVVGGSIVNAAASVNNFRLACTPQSMGHDTTADCYLIANLANDGGSNDGAGLHGIITKANTIHNLNIVSTEANFSGVGSEKLTNGQSSQLVSGLGNGQSYTCKTESGAPCYLFITKTTGKGLIQYSKSNKTVSDATLTVLSTYKVKLTEQAEVGSCGTLCVDVQYALTDTDYTSTLYSSGSEACAEIKVTTSGSVVGTGNFASYAVLAAGAFIAVAAIAIAKKHNKFYRV